MSGLNKYAVDRLRRKRATQDGSYYSKVLRNSGSAFNDLLAAIPPRQSYLFTADRLLIIQRPFVTVTSQRSLGVPLATSTFEPFAVAGLATRHGTPDGDGLTADTHLFLRPGRPSRGPVGRKKHDGRTPRACAQRGRNAVRTGSGGSTT